MLQPIFAFSNFSHRVARTPEHVWDESPGPRQSVDRGTVGSILRLAWALHVLDGRDALKHMKRHLKEEEEAENDEHSNREDATGRQEALVLATNSVEEEQTELLDEKRDGNAIDGTTVDILVDLRPLVGEVDVVSVHSVLHDHVEESEGSNQRADDGVGDREGENEQEPAVVDPERKLVDDSFPHRADFRLGAREAESHRVHDQLRKSDELEPRPHQSRSGDVVDEKSPIIRQKDALPVDRVFVRIWVIIGLSLLLQN